MKWSGRWTLLPGCPTGQVLILSGMQPSLKMGCHSFVFFLVFMYLWGWQYIIRPPGRVVMSNYAFPLYLGFLPGVWNCQSKSANEKTAICRRNNNVPTHAPPIIMMSLYYENFVGGAGPNTHVFEHVSARLFRAQMLRDSCQTVISHFTTWHCQTRSMVEFYF